MRGWTHLKPLCLGPYKVIPQEMPQIKCCSIDLIVPSKGSEQTSPIAEQLLSEVVNDFSQEVIALRNNSRWVQTFEPTAVSENSEQDRLRPGGVYLITGGLGGIGLALAHHLVEQYQAKVALLSRSNLPPQEEWSQILQDAGDKEGIGYKIRQVQSLKEMGAELLILAADVADHTQMESALAQIEGKLGPLNGVIHAAGVPSSGLIVLKDLESVNSVFKPKVMGTLILDELLKDKPLDFMVLFSSMSAITGGGPGQVDYCAANAFLDAFARQKARQSCFTVSIGWGEWQWDAWQEGLEGFQPEIRDYFKAKRQRFGISFAEGFTAMRRILSHPTPHLVVSTQDFQEMVRGSSEFSVATIRDGYEEWQGARPKHPRPALGTSYVVPSNDLERKIATIWSDLLGIDDIGANDNFFELGGNSLIGIDMVARVRTALESKNITAHIIYETPTISTLAKHLSQDSNKEVLFSKTMERGKRRHQRSKRKRGSKRVTNKNMNSTKGKKDDS